MPDPILQTRGLNAYYGDFQALYDVELDVGEGEVLAIIGANGAGKTTLMRSLTGLLTNGPGQVHFRGQFSICQADSRAPAVRDSYPFCSFHSSISWEVLAIVCP